MKRPALIAAILALLVAPSAYVAWTGRDQPHFGQGHDDSIYYAGAKSIAQGHGYRLESLPDAPSQTKYPPLLSLYLAPVWHLAPGFPANLPLAALFMWAWLPAWVAVSYLLFRDLGLDWRVALGLCGVIALNPQTAHFGVRTQPELMFAALWTASAALAMRRRGEIPGGLLAGLAYLAKTAALPMIVAAPLWYIARREFRRAALFVVVMLPAVIGWNLWTRAHLVKVADPLRMYYTDYLGYHLYTVGMAGYGRILAKNLDALLGAMGGVLDFGDTPGILARAAGVVIFLGTVRHFRRVGLNPYHVFAGAYMALLVVWHYPPDARFLLPVLPVLLAGLWTELATAYHALDARPLAAKTFAAAAAAIVLFVGVSGWRGLLDSFPRFRSIQAENYYPAYDWIARNTRPDQTFLANDDVVLYLFTGRRALRPSTPMAYFYRDDVADMTAFVTSRPAIARREGLDFIFDCPRDWRRDLLPAGLRLPELSHRKLAEDPGVRRLWSSGGSSIYAVN